VPAALPGARRSARTTQRKLVAAAAAAADAGPQSSSEELGDDNPTVVHPVLYLYLIRTPAVILCCCWGLNRTCPHKTSVHSSSTGELVLRLTQPVMFGEAWGAHTIWCGLLARC
jgi:hypothetical protein